MADKDIVATIRKRDQERARRIMEHLHGDGAYDDVDSQRLAMGLDFLVKDYRETAELFEQAKMRGGKSQADDRKTVAAVLALLAVELRKPSTKSVTVVGAGTVPALRAEKRCGKVEQHEAHTWTEWVNLPTPGEQRADVYACPGWSAPPRDLSGLKALVAERSGHTVTFTEPIPLQPGMHTVTMPIDPKPGDTIVFDASAFSFDEPPAVTPPFDSSADKPSADGAAQFDEPPPPGQAVTLKGEVFSYGKLREIRRDVQGSVSGMLAQVGLPEHVSHSQISTFGECGLKGLLTRSDTLGVEQLPQWASVGGTAMHLAVERFERMVHEVRTLQYVTDRLRVAGGTGRWWNEAFRDTVAEVAKDNPHAPVATWRESKQGREGYTWWLVEGEAMLGRYVKARLAELESPWRRIMTVEFADEETKTIGRVPMVEHEFVMDVEGTPFKGVIDQVWEVTANFGWGVPDPGDLVIDDVKSGSGPNDDSQLREYALWLSLDGGGRGRRIWGRFIDVRGGEIASAPFILLVDPDATDDMSASWDELAFKVEHTAGLKASGSFMPRRNNYCVACPVKHACPIMAAKL